MGNYSSKKAYERIREIMDTEYERMYPFEIERELLQILKETEDNQDEETKKKIIWEIDLLNRTLGHKATYNGETVIEINNKWKYLLEEGKWKPFNDEPFCTWKKEAIDYYKQRFKETNSYLSKARYAFAIMTFSGKERLEWMKSSVDNWKKTAEKYVNDGQYKEGFYEIPPFAYEFALKLSLSFGQKDLAKNILDSLHDNILRILASGEKRWYLEFFEVEAKYINSLTNVDEIKKDSVGAIRDRIKLLKKEFKKSSDKNKSNHFLRNLLELLLKYGKGHEYDIHQQIAESYILEAEARDDPLVKSSIYNKAIKKYQYMLNKYPEKKITIQRRIDELTLKLKELNSKVEYKSIGNKIKFTDEQIKQFLENFRKQDEDLLIAFLDDNSLFPNHDEIQKETEEQRKQFPLQFMIPITIYNAEEPILEIKTESDIFDFQFRKNILMGIRVGEVMCKIVMESIQKEMDEAIWPTIEGLINQDELEDIKFILNTGFTYVFQKIDITAALHILLPYIEEMIRLIIKKAGEIDVVLETHKQKFFRGIQLGSLLSDERVQELIGFDFQKTLKVLLVDEDQSNLRNELLHGRLSSNKINEAQTMFVAYCLLKLIKILQDTEKHT